MCFVKTSVLLQCSISAAVKSTPCLHHCICHFQITPVSNTVKPSCPCHKASPLYTVQMGVSAQDEPLAPSIDNSPESWTAPSSPGTALPVLVFRDLLFCGSSLSSQGAGKALKQRMNSLNLYMQMTCLKGTDKKVHLCLCFLKQLLDQSSLPRSMFPALRQPAVPQPRGAAILTCLARKPPCRGAARTFPR